MSQFASGVLLKAATAPPSWRVIAAVVLEFSTTSIMPTPSPVEIQP